MADSSLFDAGLRPRVLINWESFERRGMSPEWRRPFRGAVINAYTRWADIAGVDVRFQFAGSTSKTYVSDGEVLISMDDRHPTEPRLTSTFGAHNQVEIVFHRLNGLDLSPWNFVPFHATPDELDMQAILVHEFGHCLGLDHSPSPLSTLASDYDLSQYRFGPWSGEIARARRLYPDFTANRLRQLRSTDGGLTWTPVVNELTRLEDARLRTRTSPSVVALAPGAMYVVAWTTVAGMPASVRGDGVNFLTRHLEPTAEERYLYGPALATDGQQRLLQARVRNDGIGTIELTRSNDQGYRWQPASGTGPFALGTDPSAVGTHWPPGWQAGMATPGPQLVACTYGTPGLACTTVDGHVIWILVWSHLARVEADHAAPPQLEWAASGQLAYSLSADFGETWTPAQRLEGASGYAALAGVSVAADTNNHVLIAFAWAPHATHGLNQIRTFVCEVVGHSLVLNQVVRGDAVTRLQPALTFDPITDRFLMAWRDQDVHTSLSVATLALGERHWTPSLRLETTTSTAPALAAMPALGETVLWYASE